MPRYNSRELVSLQLGIISQQKQVICFPKPLLFFPLVTEKDKMKTKISGETGFMLLLIPCGSNHMQLTYTEVLQGLFKN